MATASSSNGLGNVPDHEVLPNDMLEPTGGTSMMNDQAEEKVDILPSSDTSSPSASSSDVARFPSPPPSASPAALLPPPAILPPSLEAVPEHEIPNLLEENMAPGANYNKPYGWCDDIRSTAATDSTTPSPIPSEPDLIEKPRSLSMSKMGSQDGSVRKLSANQVQDLMSVPESLPVAPAPVFSVSSSVTAFPQQTNPSLSYYPLSADAIPNQATHITTSEERDSFFHHDQSHVSPTVTRSRPHYFRRQTETATADSLLAFDTDFCGQRVAQKAKSNRTSSTPPIYRKKYDIREEDSVGLQSPRRCSFHPPRPTPLNLDMAGARPGTTPTSRTISSHPPNLTSNGSVRKSSGPQPLERASLPSPPPSALLPLPPMSLPTHLQLELAGQRPSPLYIYQVHPSNIPYESSAVKFERLKNFLLLPPMLERTLYFGALTCLDAWLYTYTILPLRFFIALGVLLRWWGYVIGKEVKWVVGFVWLGIWRVWERARGRSRGRTSSEVRETSTNLFNAEDSREMNQSRSNVPCAAPVSGSTIHDKGNGYAMTRKASERLDQPENYPNRGFSTPYSPSRRRGTTFARHRRTKSMPSSLSSFHKADLLQGAVILISSVFLMNLDASRMYHFIRAQSAMKLYVIFNLLEVLDRLLGSLGQDIFECLFSSETLSRNSLGRSKVLLPFGMLLLSLLYNTAHATTLFFMVITLNVAVNSYSNALLTLLLSNQFVEIKGAVFKRFEKENLFQMTCADVVERFQLWVFLFIIALRNIVEVGGLSVPGAGVEGDPDATTSAPIHSPSILPFSFTLIPSWMWSGEVLSPFLIVVGSEMLVDWVKHAFITKFNGYRPKLYGRMLDILVKDYYESAFISPSVLSRLGLPLIPISCLFIRAGVQTYHMVLSTHIPPPIPTSTQTSLEQAAAATEAISASGPGIKDTLDRIDSLIRGALGRNIYGDPFASLDDQSATAANRSMLTRPWYAQISTDDIIAGLTMLVVFFLVWLVLLAAKLLLGMLLLRYARDRYGRILKREEEKEEKTEQKRERESWERKNKREDVREKELRPGNSNSKKGYDLRGNKRFGGWGTVQVGEERRRIVYEDDPTGLKRMRDKESKNAEKMEKGEDRLASTVRYEMSCKRIW